MIQRSKIDVWHDFKMRSINKKNEIETVLMKKKGGAAFAAPRGQRGGLDEDDLIIISNN